MSNKPPKVVSIVGARPQFLKEAAIHKAIKKHNEDNPQNPIQEILIHTGQHYDYELSAIFFQELELPSPDYHLGVGSGSHGAQTGKMLELIEEVLIKEEPDAVIVYGDTNSTLAGAFAAAKLHIPVAYVEAGLRSYNRKIPEEINRILTDHISTWLFCPSERAAENLKKEGITEGVYVVGDVMYDVLLEQFPKIDKHIGLLERLEVKPKSYALATVHRAENTDDPGRLRAIFEGLEKIAMSGLPVILPLHPRIKKAMEAFGIKSRKVTIIKPVSYLEILCLEKMPVSSSPTLAECRRRPSSSACPA